MNKDKMIRDYALCLLYLFVCLLSICVFSFCNNEKWAMGSFVGLCCGVGLSIGTMLRYHLQGERYIVVKKYIWLFTLVFTAIFLIGGVVNYVCVKSWMFQLAIVALGLLVALVVTIARYIKREKA